MKTTKCLHTAAEAEAFKFEQSPSTVAALNTAADVRWLFAMYEPT